MKKLAAILCFSAVAMGAFAQGTVSFLNTASTLISYAPSSGTAVLPSGAPGTYIFGLLTGPLGSTDPASFTFTGLYGTNLTQAGVVFGGAGRSANGWATGADQSYIIAGWSVDNGYLWNDAWRTTLPGSGYFGFSTVAHGVAGGPSGGGAIPPLNLFGGAPSLTQGFVLQPVPEPATMALAGLGAAALLIFRRRK